MPAHFEKTYGPGKFELVGVKDLAVEGCLNEAVKGALAPLAPLLGRNCPVRSWAYR